jgi:hypothetical protein
MTPTTLFLRALLIIAPGLEKTCFMKRVLCAVLAASRVVKSPHYHRGRLIAGRHA